MSSFNVDGELTRAASALKLTTLGSYSYLEESSLKTVESMFVIGLVAAMSVACTSEGDADRSTEAGGTSGQTGGGAQSVGGAGTSTSGLGGSATTTVSSDVGGAATGGRTSGAVGGAQTTTSPGVGGAASGGRGSGGATASSGGTSTTGGKATAGSATGGNTQQASPPHWVVGYYVGYQSSEQPPAEIDWTAMSHVAMGVVLANSNGTLDLTFY